MNMLYLTDAKLDDFDAMAEIPVVDGWRWQISGDGTGYLLSPDDTEYCKFSVMNGTIQFEPDGDVSVVSGLDLTKVQEMGEQYMDEVLFSEAEQADLSTYLEDREEQTKNRKKEIYAAIKGSITLSYDGHGNWETYVDTDKVKELSGIETASVLQGKDEGVKLFNRIAETMMTNSSLKDPCGYMKKPDNLYDCIYHEYESQYNNALSAIDNGFMDGTGYSVQSVLENLPKIVRSDVTKQIVPKGEKYSDLRFVTPTNEQKGLVKDMVKARLGLTLIYEKKRSYEAETIEKATKTLQTSCDKLNQAIYGGVQVTKTAETPMTM